MRTRLASLTLGVLLLGATYFVVAQSADEDDVGTRSTHTLPPPIYSPEIDARKVMELLRRRVPRSFPIYALRGVAPFQMPLVWARPPEQFDPLEEPNATGAIHPTEITTSAMPAELGGMTFRVATLYGRAHSNLLLDRPFLALHPSPGLRVEVHVYPTPEPRVRRIVRAWVRDHLGQYTGPDPTSRERGHQA